MDTVQHTAAAAAVAAAAVESFDICAQKSVDFLSLTHMCVVESS